ncbi:MAG: hypothetical protein IJA61_00305 [Clostridia bacterium]|nr:hypothetical protein [Clostridia bacterium]
MGKSLLTLISGSSGAGKNTVIAELINKHEDYTLLKSSTTRQKRIDDKLQKDGEYAYYFLSKEEFEEKINQGEMLEYDIFSDNYYGVSKGSIEKMLKISPFVLKDITVKGAINCKNILKDKINITTIFLTLKKSTLIERLKKRGTKDIKNRMKHYKFEQLSIPLYDYCIENTDLNVTLRQIEAIQMHESENLFLYLGKNKKINENKIQKIENKLKANKKVRNIEVVESQGKIFIVKGINEYLASIRTKIDITKRFVLKQIQNCNQEQWLEILDQYK